MNLLPFSLVYIFRCLRKTPKTGELFTCPVKINRLLKQECLLFNNVAQNVLQIGEVLTRYTYDVLIIAFVLNRHQSCACYPSVWAAFILSVTFVLFRCLLFEFQSFHNYLGRAWKDEIHFRVNIWTILNRFDSITAIIIIYFPRYGNIKLIVNWHISFW